MAKKQRPSFLKRQKEIARQQKQREKAARRKERKLTRTEGGPQIEPLEPEQDELDDAVREEAPEGNAPVEPSDPPRG